MYIYIYGKKMSLDWDSNPGIITLGIQPDALPTNLPRQS